MVQKGSSACALPSGSAIFRTMVDFPRWEQPMKVHQKFVFLGSCFAENIGSRFCEYGLKALVNPVGVLYNPLSIYSVVSQALQPQELPLFKAADEWRCWLAGTLLGGSTKKLFHQTVEGSFMLLGQALAEADHVFLTLGTNVSYQLVKEGITVANCHRQPSSLFSEHRLSLDEAISWLRKTIDLLISEHSGLKVHLTVSPYRYTKYGFHESQLSKATLLLATEQLCKEYADVCSYLPVYELMMDELRDYRFYNSDMLHPSPVAVDYIWQRITEACMDEEMQTYLTEYEPIRKALMHKPLKPQSRQYEAFLKKTELMAVNLKKKYAITE